MCLILIPSLSPNFRRPGIRIGKIGRLAIGDAASVERLPHFTAAQKQNTRHLPPNSPPRSSSHIDS
jgi:hypothetical protein